MFCRKHLQVIPRVGVGELFLPVGSTEALTMLAVFRDYMLQVLAVFRGSVLRILPVLQVSRG